MRPTEILRAEHEHILRACAVLHAMAAQLDKGGELAVGDATLIVDFIRHYADGLHHAKEEHVLFPALIDAGLPGDGGPIAVMLNDHERGRGHVQGMLAALPSLQTPGGRGSFAASARGFADLLQGHIAKENNVLFVMAERMLPATTDGALLSGYAVREAEARKTCGEKAAHEGALAELSGRWL